MAELRNVDIQGSDIIVNMRITRDEYNLLGQRTGDIALIPAGDRELDHTLTSGKLGNSNRIMLPKKLLNMEGIVHLEKKLASRFFRVNGSVYLLIRLRESDVGIPMFMEEGK